MEKHLRNLGKLIFSLAATLISGVLSFVIGRLAADGWYEQLQRPDFVLPGWAYGPVWLVLYILMGIAAYVVWKQGTDRHKIKPALWFYLTLLLLNVAWAFVFFQIKSPGLGVLVLSLSFCVTLAVIILFNKVRNVAGGLLFPYLLWISYLMAINFAIWILN